MFGNKCQILLAAVPRFSSIACYPVTYAAYQSITPSSLWGLVWCYTEGSHQSEGCPVTPTINGPPHHCHPHTGSGHTQFTCAVCLFILWYSAEWYVHTCGSPRYTQRVMDSVMRSICIVCVAYNMIFSVLFEKVYILTAYISGKYRHHLL